MKSLPGIAYLSASQEYGGAEKYIEYLCRQFHGKSFRCTVIINNDNVKFLESLKELNLEVISLPFARRYFDVRCEPELVITLKAVHPQILHINLPGPYDCLLSAISARLAGVTNIVTTEHLPMAKRWPKPALLKRISSFFVCKAITVSEINRHYLRCIHHVDDYKIRVIHNGIDTAEFSLSASVKQRESMRLRLRLHSSDLAFGIVGRLTRQKGHTYALEAFSQISSRFPNAKLVIVGSGELEHDLRQFASELNLANQVTFAGFLNDMPSVYAAIDILVMPSLFEGLPFSLIEAMSMGRPVIASAVNGIPEIVKNGRNGILIPPRSSQALAEAIKDICGNQTLLLDMGKAAAHTVRTDFSIERMCSATRALYLEMLDGHA
jgi:glycosyltransferase involved in cell wall biosynthesis